MLASKNFRKRCKRTFLQETLRKIPQKLIAGDLHEEGLAFAFTRCVSHAPRPYGEAFGVEAVAGFDFAGGDGKRVIKVGGVGEIAHAKLIEPFERAGAGLAADDHVDG